MIINPYRFASAAPPATPVGRAVIYSGTGSAQSITGAGFSPDLVIIKSRGTTNGWRWTDNVRGTTKSLNSASSGAEATETGGVTSFDADGFTIGNDADYNTNASNYLALCLQRVAGAFDIVTYTGTGAAHTISHGLGVAPELIIIGNRSNAGVNWAVYPGPLASPETKFLLMQTTASAVTDSTYWNNTTPTSSVFTVGTNSVLNSNTQTYVAWLFASLAGSVKVGSYTGDGNATGPTVTTGFKPRFVLVKRTDNTGNWRLFDDARDTSNPSGIFNSLNSTAAENTLADGVDFQSTGFAFTDTGGAAAVNINGATYIYVAVA